MDIFLIFSKVQNKVFIYTNINIYINIMVNYSSNPRRKPIT